MNVLHCFDSSRLENNTGVSFLILVLDSDSFYFRDINLANAYREQICTHGTYQLISKFRTSIVYDF